MSDKLEFPTQSEWRSLAFPAWRRGHLPGDRFVCWRDQVKGKLGWYLPTLAAFWDAGLCNGIKLVRLLPARGGGMATVDLVMRNPFSRWHEEVTERVLRHDDCNGLDEAAKELAEFWGLALRVDEYRDE